MALNPLVSLIGRLLARSGRKRGNRQTDGRTERGRTERGRTERGRNDKTTTVTLAAHARRGLMKLEGGNGLIFIELSVDTPTDRKSIKARTILFAAEVDLPRTTRQIIVT